MLTSSLGRLSDKQRDILEESKESCERLVRLVSMFLNYSALESGKLVLQLRENDLRDCLDELAKRWLEAFQRKGVRLDAAFDPSIPNFRFDYQKVQQAAANLLDNALKHTPVGGCVTLRALPHFWETTRVRGFAAWRNAGASVCRVRTAWKYPWRTQDRESRRSITRKFSRISCASIAILREWGWASRLQSA